MKYASLAELTASRRAQTTAAEELVGEGLRTFLADLYPDNAHFIYELLQNAEDAKATGVEFDLKQSRLVFTHNGTDAFTLADVEAITTIGSTKVADDTKIGKFGVGFKAVFSYTARPQVRSGDYAFAIEDLFVPVPIDGTAPGISTVFTLPFDRKEKPKNVAYSEIERGLRELGDTTVLFLRNIQSIRYRLTDGSSGHIRRIDGEYPFVRISRKVDGESTESHWLRLVGDSQLSATIPKGQNVAAAFRLDDAPTKRKMTQGRLRGVEVEALAQADTCVYFPAVRESSGLRFHIHAPFAPTPARDSIKDIPGNADLVEAIGRLIAKELPRLRDEGWITDGLLAALPNSDDVLVGPYTAIRDRVYEAFTELPVTPVLGGKFARASELVTSPSAFRVALDLPDLKKLTGFLERDFPSKPQWLPDRAGRAGRFLSGLGAHAFSWNELRDVFRTVGLNYQVSGNLREPWSVWLSKKSSDRLKAMYELIGHGLEEDEFELNWYVTSFKGPLVRVKQGRSKLLVPAPDAYLPETPEDTTDGRVLAELAYFEDDKPTKSKSRLSTFYDRMGVRRWDDRAQVEQRLADYKSQQWPNAKQHLADLRLFIGYLKDHLEQRALFDDTCFLKVKYPNEEYRWAPPGQVFLDKPYLATGLAKLYSGAGEPFALVNSYRGKVAGLEDFILALGGTDSLKIQRANVRYNDQYDWSWNSVGSRETVQGMKIDWDLVSLDDVLKTKDRDLLHSLWTLTLESKDQYGRAFYQLNGSSSIHKMDSQLFQRLSGARWVLDRAGKLRNPESMSLEDLPEGWPEPPVGSLAIALGFGAEARARDELVQERQRQASEVGVPIELLDALQELPEAERDSVVADLIAQVHARRNFPGSTSANPERRTAMVGSDAHSAPAHTTEKRSRSVVTGRNEASEFARQYLKAEYTDVSGELHCQLCKMTMPFKVNGEWYFEAIQFLPKRAKVHHQNALALCPLCAALYRFTRKTTDTALVANLHEQANTANSGRVSVPVEINGKRLEIWFTGKHALDLRAVLDAAGGKR